MEELRTQPQIVSGYDERSVAMAAELFGRISNSIIRMSPLEAELTKIFTNVWRYIQFATANQFFMIAAANGLDFYRIYDAMMWNYPRMAGLPKSGFAAGPCLFKDTMQLAAATDNSFAPGPGRHAHQRGTTKLHRRTDQAEIQARGHAGRDPRHGVQGR